MAGLTGANIFRVRTLTLLLIAALLLSASSLYFGKGYAGYETAQAAQAGLIQSYQELIELSQKEKKGLTFFVRGQTVAGVVVRTIGNEAVEVRSQTYSRVIIRLESVDAVAIN
jgi:hypothetical protein